jgi:1-acyl-sn-glycerol-3-phosphate acyltransferase
VHFGPALGFSGRVGDERSAPIRREITETVRAAVQRLSGQDYVDRYAASVKAGGPIARLGPARWTVTTTGP